MDSPIFILLITFAYSQICATNETLFNTQCIQNSCFDTYLKRLKQVDGVEIMTFTSAVEYLYQYRTKQQEIYVTLKFTELDLNDGTMYRDNVNSCITDKLYSYKIGWEDEQLANYNITSTYDYTDSLRVWQFTIPASDF